jgi:hypothetical protein
VAVARLVTMVTVMYMKGATSFPSVFLCFALDRIIGKGVGLDLNQCT